jgi:hypothetical protein
MFIIYVFNFLIFKDITNNLNFLYFFFFYLEQTTSSVHVSHARTGTRSFSEGDHMESNWETGARAVPFIGDIIHCAYTLYREFGTTTRKDQGGCEAPESSNDTEMKVIKRDRRDLDDKAEACCRRLALENGHGILSWKGVLLEECVNLWKKNMDSPYRDDIVKARLLLQQQVNHLK